MKSPIIPTLLSLFAALSLTNVAMAANNTHKPSGRYCGKVLSSGVMSNVETSFEMNASNGAVVGSYVFAEQTQPVDGVLAEADDGDSNELTRTFIWRDKYGYGKLNVTFTPNFSEFEGKWSDGGLNFLPWNGTRCGLIIS